MGKQSELITAYNKERARIKRQINRLRKRGYEIDDDILPDKPKRVTQASINRLAKITLNKLYEKSIKLDEETGEIIEGKEAKKIEASEQAKKAAKTRKINREENSITLNVVTKKDYEEIQFSVDDYSKPYVPSEDDLTIGRFFDDLENFKYGKGFTHLWKWANDMLSQLGRQDFAEMVKEAYADGNIITWECAYNDTEATKYISTLKRYIPDGYNKREFMSKIEEGFDSYDEPE